MVLDQKEAMRGVIIIVEKEEIREGMEVRTTNSIRRKSMR